MSGRRTEQRTIDFRFQPAVQQTCIAFVDDPYKTIVREDGSVNYHYVGRNNDLSEKQRNYASDISSYADFVDENHDFLHRLKPRFSHRDRLLTRTQDFGDPRVAIVRTEERYEHSTLAWETFAYRDVERGVRADVILWELSADDEFGRAPSRVELALFGPREGAPAVVQSQGTTAYWTAEALQLRGLHHYAFLSSGQRRRGVFVVVLAGTLDPATVTVPWADSQREAIREYWLNLHPFRSAFSIPDRQIQEMVESCARNILQAREIHNGIAEYQVGPTIYRGLWAVDGYFLLEAAQIMGDHEAAFEQGLLAILRRVRPDGSLDLIPRHYKETGIAIATIVRQCELAGDNERLQELWPTILRAADYIRTLREEARALGPGYPAHELFPPAFVDGGIDGPFPDYSTPAWILIGLKAARDAGTRLGLGRADELAALYDDIYGAFARAAARDRRVTDAGIPYIPMIMEHREYDKPQTATWAFAQAMHPGEVFGPDHEYVRDLLRLLDSIDDKQGIPAETGWIHDQGVWGYSAMFYAEVWLYAGRADKAIDYLYAFANHAAPSRVWREEQSLSSTHSAEYCGDMPHNWGSAEFIRLVRNAVVLERGEQLELLVGLPPEWLPDDDQALEIDSTPTRYGSISVRLSAEGAAAERRYRLEYRRIPGVVDPTAVVVHWNDEAHTDLIAPSDIGAARTIDLPSYRGGRGS